MDLIYAKVINNTIIDQSPLHNFTLDLTFGENDNDFVLKMPESGVRLDQDMVVYVSDTEFGGIIDSIEIDTAKRMINYYGRTFQGILESKVLYPFDNSDYLIYSGEANTILGQILERLTLTNSSSNELPVHPDGAFLKASTEDSGIYIESYKVSSTSGNYAHGYSFIREMLYSVGAKPLIINGVLEAVPYVDYANDFEWVQGTDHNFKAKRNYNSCNHIHCMGQGNLSDRYKIDLYLDENGGLLPYAHSTITSDADYYTDIAALADGTFLEKADYETITENMVTGVNEICEIYDYPSAQTTYHYVLQESQPSDWDTVIDSSSETYGFESAYILNQEADDENEAEYVAITKPDKTTRYDLLSSQPSNWTTSYEDYYVVSSSGYTNVTAGEYTLLSSQPSNWTTSYDQYFIKSGNTYTTVQTYEALVLLTSQPSNWATQYSQYYTSDGSSVAGVETDGGYTEYKGKQPANWSSTYSNYYYKDGIGNYISVPGTSKTGYTLQSSKPGNWNSGWKNYYMNKTTTTSSGKKKTTKVTVGSVKKSRPKWKAKTYYTSYSYTVAPDFKNYNKLYTKNANYYAAPAFVANTYYYKYSGAPTFAANTYYKYSDCPTFKINTYYKAVEYQPIPEWQSDYYYTRYEDHYQTLVEGAIAKFAELQTKDELSIDLTENKAEYDINDRVGASDEVTGLSASAKIVQKTVKIERGITTIEYEVGSE